MKKYQYISVWFCFLFIQLTLWSQELKIHQINVGQGAATLIEVFDVNNARQYAMLVDAGNRREAATIRNYLQSLGIDTVNYFIPTHYDRDHLGGAVGTDTIPGLLTVAGMSAIRILCIADRGDNPLGTSALSGRYRNLISESNIPRNLLAPGQVIPLFNQGGFQVNFRIIAVNGRTSSFTASDPDENDLSVVGLLTFTYGGDTLFSFLIAGDLSGEIGYQDPSNPNGPPLPGTGDVCGYNPVAINTPLGDAVESQLGGHVCGCLVSHHGANNAYLGGLANLGMSFALVSTGKHAGYQHPRPDPLVLLAAMVGTSIYITAANHYGRTLGQFVNGHIVVCVKADGTITINGVNVTCSHHNNNP